MAHKRSVNRGNLRRSGVFKSLMVLTYLLSIIGMVAGCMFTVEFVENGMYTEKPDGISRRRLEEMCWQEVMEVNNRYWEMEANGYYNETLSENYRRQLYDDFMNDYDPEKRNFEFVISDPEERVIFESFTDGSYRYSRTEPFYETTHETILETRMTPEELDNYAVEPDMEVSVEEVWIQEPMETTAPTTEAPPTPQPEIGGALEESVVPVTDPIIPEVENYVEVVDVLYYDVTITRQNQVLTHYVTGYVRSDLTADDQYAQYEKFIKLAYDYRYVPIIVLAASVIAFLASLIFLIAAAGYHKGEEKAAAGIFDKIPYDIFTVMMGFFGIMVIYFLDDTVNSFGGILQVGLVCCGLAAAALAILWWITSTAVRIRTKTILTNNLIVILGRSLTRGIRKYITAMQGLPLLWQIPLAALGFFFLQMCGMVMLWNDNGFGLMLIILMYTIAAIVICVMAASMHQLEKGAEKIAGGDLSYKIPDDKLAMPFKKHGHHLNSIGEGMNLAVNERIKSEMFKTELIANVSHDIRTPLTSIINYTDLLSKLELNDPKAAEYLEVLARQSARLRKLTEDVLEASKATTGNMNVQKEKMDLRVLLEQMQGEYAEKLETKSLQIVCTMPEEPLYITADGRLLWRVMDNLFGNVCKYAMQGTRVYLDAAAANGKVTLTLRNISAVQLHVSADALMERFVQGDRSRNTEGSGLGLSIAQSLTDLQGGSMKISIDGDLFKVILTFDETVF